MDRSESPFWMKSELSVAYKYLVDYPRCSIALFQTPFIEENYPWIAGIGGTILVMLVAVGIMKARKKQK